MNASTHPELNLIESDGKYVAAVIDFTIDIVDSETFIINISCGVQKMKNTVNMNGNIQVRDDCIKCNLMCLVGRMMYKLWLRYRINNEGDTAYGKPVFSTECSGNITVKIK